jgi:hypothetical protein
LPFPDADFGTFNNATAAIEEYYTDELAQMVNDWARADLDTSRGCLAKI